MDVAGEAKEKQVPLPLQELLKLPLGRLLVSRRRPSCPGVDVSFNEGILSMTAVTLLHFISASQAMPEASSASGNACAAASWAYPAQHGSVSVCLDPHAGGEVFEIRREGGHEDCCRCVVSCNEQRKVEMLGANIPGTDEGIDDRGRQHSLSGT